MNKRKIIALSALLMFVLQACAQQNTFIIQTDKLPAADTLSVYFPEIYHQNSNSYPMLVLLHGWSGNHRQWGEIADLQQAANQYEFVIVCPDGFYDSWYIDHPQRNDAQFGRFLGEDLITYARSNWRIDTAAIFISGLSMGGHGALLTMINYPEIFKAAASTSGVVNLVERTLNFGLVKVLGKQDVERAQWEQYSVYQNIDKLKDFDNFFFFDCGRDDPFFQMNRNLYQKCIDLELDASFLAMPGKHDAVYWHKSIEHHLLFFSQILNKE